MTRVRKTGMGETLDLEDWWPDLFDGLDQTQRVAVVQSFAAAWHAGWVPNREDVELVTDNTRGTIDHEEFARRVAEIAGRRHGTRSTQR